MPDPICRPVDGLVDLQELRETTEVGMPLQQLVERLVGHGVTQACDLKLGSDLVVDVIVTQRQ
jgi:hypothetical protein